MDASYACRMSEAGLRERRKQRTRDALSAAAARLFREKGYANTTVAEIAAAAEVSTKTLFNYFSGKEDLLFAHRNDRLDRMHQLFVESATTEAPAVALRRAAKQLIADTTADDDGQARLVLSTPELRARALLLVYDNGLRLAEALQDAYPDTIDPVTAAAAAGSLVGAVQTAVIATIDRGASLAEVTEAASRAIDVALGGWELLQASD